MTDYEFTLEIKDFCETVIAGLPISPNERVHQLYSESLKRLEDYKQKPISLLNIKKQGGEQ